MFNIFDEKYDHLHIIIYLIGGFYKIKLCYENQVRIREYTFSKVNNLFHLGLTF